ncbi:MAG TPA: hypothetical protein VIM04_09875, partial [Candidatus Binatia bacterium]
PYVIEAVKVLDDVLRRMQRHQAKKSALLRPLTIADNFGRQNRRNRQFSFFLMPRRLPGCAEEDQFRAGDVTISK